MDIHTYTERAQCILWIAGVYSKKVGQRLFVEKYEKIPPERSTIREWYQVHQSKGDMHRGVEMGTPE